VVSLVPRECRETTSLHREAEAQDRRELEELDDMADKHEEFVFNISGRRVPVSVWTEEDMLDAAMEDHANSVIRRGDYCDCLYCRIR
jgi:hypothetical protein